MKLIGQSLIYLFFIILLSCDKDIPQLPEIKTKAIYYRTQNSAQSGGIILSDGGAEITECGVCWSGDPEPDIDDYRTISILKGEEFSSNINGLSAESVYYARAYASNSAGTAYGSQMSIHTLSPVIDIDGNAYNSVIIDNQIWLSENLKTSHYANGDPISDGTGVGDISNETEPKYSFSFNDDPGNVNKYGRLYTWYAAADSRNICPEGWHVPSASEWDALFAYLGGRDIAGGKLKESGTDTWYSPNTGATNEACFNAIPAGKRYGNGDFVALGYTAQWWTSTTTSDLHARTYFLRYEDREVFYFNYYTPSGFSVRCIKNR